MLAVSELVQANATVLLTGDGGDDVFLGYPEHRNLWLAQKTAAVLPRPVLHSWKTLRRFSPPGLKRARSFLDFVAGGLPAATCVRDGLPNYGPMLTGELQGRTIPQRQAPWSDEGGRTLLYDFLNYDFNQRFTGEYLPKVDGGTMHYALEARSPFLDQQVWEYAAGLPVSVRLRNHQLKAVLRTIASRNIAPDIASLRKRGFTIPVQRWLTTRWRTRFEAAFDKPVLGDTGWVSTPEVRAGLQRAIDRGEEAPIQLWYLFVLENWLHSA
jgi:asparagine synthase (glutamine-hydrolysing)